MYKYIYTAFGVTLTYTVCVAAQQWCYNERFDAGFPVCKLCIYQNDPDRNFFHPYSEPDAVNLIHNHVLHISWKVFLPPVKKI